MMLMMVMTMKLGWVYSENQVSSCCWSAWGAEVAWGQIPNQEQFDIQDHGGDDDDNYDHDDDDGGDDDDDDDELLYWNKSF